MDTPIYEVQFTPDEARSLYLAFYNGLQGGTAKVRQTLTVKLERMNTWAQMARGAECSVRIAGTNGKKAPV